MISFAKIMHQVLSETMTFGQLRATGGTTIPYVSDPDSNRVDRGDHNVHARSIRVLSLENAEAWTFNYKSDPSTSTTNTRYHGFVRFLKETNKSNKSADEIPCMVDCDCPDYRYRFAYNNAKAGAGVTGGQSAVPGWGYHNRNNGAPPKSVAQGGVGNYGPGICKHLCALSEFLKTKIEPDAPKPEDKPPRQFPKKPSSKPPLPLSKQEPTIQAPKPEDSDDKLGTTTPQKPFKPTPPPIDKSPSIKKIGTKPKSTARTDSDPDSEDHADSNTIQESQGSAYQKLTDFIKKNPQFDVFYEEQ